MASIGRTRYGIADKCTPILQQRQLKKSKSLEIHSNRKYLGHFEQRPNKGSPLKYRTASAMLHLRHRQHEHTTTSTSPQHLQQQGNDMYDTEDPNAELKTNLISNHQSYSNVDPALRITESKGTSKKVPRKGKSQRRGQYKLDATFYVVRFLLTVIVVSILGGGYILYTLVLYPRIVHPPKVAVLPTDFQVSVVLMNHFRPTMIKQSSLLTTLLDHPHVSEVLLCHSNPNTTFHMEHAKVRNIDAVSANAELGLALRFYFCYTAAKSDYIVIVDDDQEVTEAALNTLLQTFAAQPHRIVGRYGRTFSPSYKQSHGYNTRTVFGNVEVILTKLLVAPRDYCGNFLRYAPVVRDLLPVSIPLWNGEDIFFSLVANHVNHVPLNGPYRNTAVFFGGVSEAPNSLKDDDSGKHDISGNMDRHMWYNSIWTHESWVDYNEAVERAKNHTAYRGTLWSTAKARLAQLKPDEEAWLTEQFTAKYAAEDVNTNGLAVPEL